MDQLKIAQFCLATKKYTKFIQEILKQDININYSIPDEPPKTLQKKAYLGHTYLHMAADKHDLIATNELINQGADFMKQGIEDDCTPLILAVRYSCKDNKEIYNKIGTLVENQVVKRLLAAQVKAGNAFNPKCKYGISHLHIACITNNVEAVEFFLNANESLDQAITATSPLLPGYTLLHCAARYSSVEVFQILLKHGANVHKKEASGMSTLHILIARLMTATDYAKSENMDNSLYVKEMKKIETMLTFLVRTWIESDVESIDEIGLTVFHVMCTLKDESIAKKFLEKNIDINSAVKSDATLWSGWIPLHFASFFNIETTKILLENGAMINIKNADGETPLDLCLRKYSPRIVHSICSSTDQLRNILFEDKSTKLLDVILSMKNRKSFGNFLKNLSDINTRIPPDSIILPGYSILHLAVSMTTGKKSFQIFGNSYDWPEYYQRLLSEDKCSEYESSIKKKYLQRIDLCLEHNGSVMQKNVDGLTPIHLAIKLGQSYVVGKLLSCCEDNAVDRDGMSHFHAACLVGIEDVAKKLLKKGAKINEQVKRTFWWYKTQCVSGFQIKTSSFEVQANSTALHMAVIMNNRDIIEYLVEKGANLHAKDARELTPIHLASALRNSKSLVQRLFGQVENLKDSATSNGFTYLHVAACANDVKSIKNLLRHDNVNVNAHFDLPAADPRTRNKQMCYKDFAGLTPLHMAVTMNSSDAIRTLIAAGADIHAKSPTTSTPLQFALSAIHKRDFVQHFVDKLKSHEHKVNAIDDSGLTLLHIACAKFDFEWASKLLKNGADPNAQIRGDEDYDGPWKAHASLHVLVSGAKSGCDSKKTLELMVNLLLEYGANVTLESDTNTPLHLAYYASASKAKIRENSSSSELGDSSDDEDPAHESDDEAVSLESSRADSTDVDLESEVSDVELPEASDEESESSASEDETATSAINEADMFFVADMLLKSLDSYAINPTNSNGFSHFHYACASNNVDIVKKCLEHGVDVNLAVDPLAMKEPGFTPLHFAISYARESTIYLLIESGADVKAEDTLGNTPLHVAMIKGVVDEHLIETLIRHGADINAHNLKGETPFELLLLSNVVTLSLLEFFLNHGCLISSAYTKRFRGIIGLAMKNSKPLDLPLIFKKLTKVCGMNYAIHSAVSVYQDGHLTVENYLDVIEKLMNMGCDIDEKDERGLTALQIATFYFNPEAIRALLLLGANMNIKSEIVETREPFDMPDDLSDHQEENIFRHILILEYIAIHKWKMELVGLDVSHINAKAIDAIFGLTKVTDKEINHCKNELHKLQDITVTSSLTMKDLLSEWKMVVEYPTMPQMQRRIIDDFFKSNQSLRKSFPNFCGLLLMQYRKIITRMIIFDEAKNAISSLCQVPYPDLCSEAILKCFTNNELKTLIDAANFI